MQHDGGKVAAGRCLIRRPQGLAEMPRRHDDQTRRIKPQHRQTVGAKHAGIQSSSRIGDPHNVPLPILSLRQHTQQHADRRADGACLTATPFMQSRYRWELPCMFALRVGQATMK